jgi:hypothetical protein
MVKKEKVGKFFPSTPVSLTTHRSTIVIIIIIIIIIIYHPEVILANE